MYVVHVLVMLLATSVAAAPLSLEPVPLTEELGQEIDPSEQARYHLFPGIKGLVSASFVPKHGGDYRLHYVAREAMGNRERRLTVSASSFESTRTHALLVERYLASRGVAGIIAGPLQCIERSILLLASRGEYESAARLADAALLDGEDDVGLRDLRDTARQLARSRGLFFPGSLYDQSGRTELLVFSGYYGLWLGIATPIAARVDDAAAIGVPLLLIPTTSVVITSAATRRVNMSDGRAGMIILGGHLGTWQGLGWASMGDDSEAYQVVRIGALAGLAGIAASAALTANGDYTPGHAEIANSGLPWGVWLGAVTAALADHEDDDVLRDMLIGSNVGVAACLIAGRDSQASRARVRFCNMAGVLGAVCGLGIDLILEVDDEDAALGIAAVGSLAGLYVGTRATATMDARDDLASMDSRMGNSSRAPSVSPRISLYSSATHPRPTPSLELALRF